jgi:transposase
VAERIEGARRAAEERRRKRSAASTAPATTPKPNAASLAAVDRAQIPSFSAFADGLQPWREELLAYFDQPTTNGYAESVISKIKVIKRRAYGLPTFNGFRKREVVACG